MALGFFLAIALRYLLANSNEESPISLSIMISIMISCVSVIPVLDNKYLSISFTCSLFKPYFLISSYHSLILFLYLTNLSTGCSPSVCSLIRVLVIATSSNVSGLILLIAVRATKDDI